MYAAGAQSDGGEMASSDSDDDSAYASFLGEVEITLWTACQKSNNKKTKERKKEEVLIFNSVTDLEQVSHSNTLYDVSMIAFC
eukprot:m.313043 g.313043  ORF g.313043 m.313043 type:complete len:83 (-) comp20253_c0_seq1:3315-3563(-)